MRLDSNNGEEKRYLLNRKDVLEAYNLTEVELNSIAKKNKKELKIFLEPETVSRREQEVHKRNFQNTTLLDSNNLELFLQGSVANIDFDKTRKEMFLSSVYANKNLFIAGTKFPSSDVEVSTSFRLKDIRQGLVDRNKVLKLSIDANNGRITCYTTLQYSFPRVIQKELRSFVEGYDRIYARVSLNIHQCKRHNRMTNVNQTYTVIKEFDYGDLETNYE